MRVIGFAFLIAVFLANTVIVPAMANPCNDSNVSIENIHSDMNTPCDDMVSQNQSSDTQDCCGGLCLKCHANQSPLTSIPKSLALPTIGANDRLFNEDTLSSLEPSPLRRPPKSHS